MISRNVWNYSQYSTSSYSRRPFVSINTTVRTSDVHLASCLYIMSDSIYVLYFSILPISDIYLSFYLIFVHVKLPLPLFCETLRYLVRKWKISKLFSLLSTMGNLTSTAFVMLLWYVNWKASPLRCVCSAQILLSYYGNNTITHICFEEACVR